jgi:DNA-binding response OmpR family regulator
MNHTQIAHRNGASRTNTSFPQWCTAGVPSSRNIQILVVDDEEPLRNLLEASLRRTGYDVIAASSGRKALELFEQHHIDLVLLDILLPGVDGFAVCAELRKQSDVPIVMLTALSRPDDIVRGFELGADDYIPKPFTFREVEARLQAILRRIAWLEEEPIFRVLAYGDIILNDEENCGTVGGDVIDMTPIEYQ